MTESTPHSPVDAGRIAAVREKVVAALRECNELADAVESFEGEELLETLAYLDSLRFVIGENAQMLQGLVRGQDIRGSWLDG